MGNNEQQLNVAEASTSQYLTFNIGDEQYAIDVGKVREVLELMDITKIPKTPIFMKGIINVRGHGIPVVDLRIIFGMEEQESTVDTCIIFIEVFVKTEIMVLGILVDSVEEVVELGPEQIEPPPKIGTLLDSTMIKGMGKVQDRFFVLLDIDRMFSTEEIEVVQEAQTVPV